MGEKVPYRWVKQLINKKSCFPGSCWQRAQFAVCWDLSYSRSHIPQTCNSFCFCYSVFFLNGVPRRTCCGPFFPCCREVSFLAMSSASLECWTVLSSCPFSLPPATKTSPTPKLPICISSLRLVASELASPSCEPQIWQRYSRHNEAGNLPEELSTLPGPSLCPPHSC